MTQYDRSGYFSLEILLINANSTFFAWFAIINIALLNEPVFEVVIPRYLYSLTISICVFSIIKLNSTDFLVFEKIRTFFGRISFYIPTVTITFKWHKRRFETVTRILKQY